MKNYTVYKHVNKNNGKSYVGITSQDPERRWANGKGYGSSSYFCNAIKKYGWDSFEHIIVADNLSKNEAIELEQTIIADEMLTNSDYGYNLTTGGEHFNHNEQTKRKMSDYHKALKGKTPQRTREAIAIGLLGNTNSRVSVSQYDSETGVLIATYESLTEASEKTGAKPCNISLACEGKIKTSVGFIWKYSCDTMPINIDAHKHKGKGVPVSQFTLEGEFLATYSSIVAAAKDNNIDQSAITKVCKGKANAVGGYCWEYATDDACF